MAEQPEQHGATEQVITSAISAIRSALENNPQLYTRFLDMLANGRLQRDAEIVLALARDATALRQFLSLLSVPAERVIGAYQDWAQRARETAASSTALPAGTAVTPASSAAPQPTPRPDLDVAALVGDAPFRAPETLPPRPLLYALLGHTYLQQGHHRQQKGQSNRARSEYLRAVEAFAEALRDAPDSPELHLYLATAHERLAQEAEALRHYVAALPLLPQQATALLSRIHQMLTPELAPALAGQQEWLASFAASPDLPSTAHPRLEILLARLALYKGSTKATQAAITHFDHALTYEPENVYALEGKGEALWRLGRAEEAAALLQQAVAGSDARASQRRQTATRLKLAQILIDLQRWAEASPLIEQALQGDPSFRPQLMLAQGWCHLARGETEQARTLAGEVLAGSPADPAIRVEAYTQRAEAQLQLQDYTAANEDARAALDLAPNHQVAIRIRAEAFIRDPQQPDVEKGIQLLQLYLRNAPSDVERLQLLLEALRTAGRPPSAIIETLERSLPAITGERQGELLLALAAAYRQAGQPEKVLATLSRVPATGDTAGSSPWWWLDGAARAELGDLEQALESYSRAVALDAGNLPLVEEHARLLTQSGRLDDALALWEVVSAVPSEQGRAALEVARLHRQRGDLPAALDSLDGALAGELETGQRQEALELRCQLADEAPLPPGDAAAVFLEAGRFYYDNNQTDSAITALRRARALAPEEATAGWYLADTLLIKSYLPDPPYVDRQRIEEALSVWEATARLQSPEEELLWPLLTRAYIAERMAYLPGAAFLALLSQATLLGERALLHEGGAYYYAALARFHRALENYSTAFAAATIAYEAFPDVDFIADEYVLCLAHMGRYEEAEEIIAQRDNLQPADWLASIQAYVTGQQNHLEDAIQRLTAIVEATPRDLWARSYRGDCCRRQGNLEAARDDYDWVWQQRSDPRFAHAGNLGLIGPAGYVLAVTAPEPDESLLREAASLLAEYTSFSVSAPYAHKMLGLCHLALGELDDAAYHLRRGIDLAGSARFLADFVRDEVEPLQRLVIGWPDGDAARDLLDTARGWLQQRIDTLSPSPSPVAELEQFLGRLPDEESRLSWTWLGIQASIARLHGEATHWQRAGQVYRQLRLADELFQVFPETAQGIDNAVEGLLQQGDDYLVENAAEQATERYAAAGQLLVETAPAVYARLGYAAFRRGDRDTARDNFSRAIAGGGEAIRQAGGSLLGDVCRLLLRDADDYWALTNYWQELADNPATEQPLRQALRAAITALAGFHDEPFQLSPDHAETTPMYPVVTPIAVELGTGLVPEDTSMEWSLFKELIPVLRERISAGFGIQIPGVRVRANEGDMPPYSYLFMLDEIPLLINEQEPDHRFCPHPIAGLVALGIAPDELQAAIEPVTGEPGCWVPLAYAERVVAAGLPLWLDPLAYMVRHLESLLLDHLTRYLGVQEVATLLDGWSQEPQGAALVRAALPDETSRLRFVWLLQALLDEKVPITAWETILRSVATTGLPGRDLSAALQAARLALREQLPGNQPGATQLALPASIENTLAPWLQHTGGAPLLAIPPEETQDALSQIRDLVAPYEGRPHLVLVVASSELRLPVRRLIALEFPHIPVLAREELLPTAAPAHAGQGAVEEAADD